VDSLVVQVLGDLVRLNLVSKIVVPLTIVYFAAYDLFFKPNIMAPGAYVFTTWPVSKGSWITDSGKHTSHVMLALAELFFH